MKMFSTPVILEILFFMFYIGDAQVKMWEEPLVIPTWEIGPAEANPTFSWSASYRKQTKPVYPYPFKEILTNIKKDHAYKACWLENEFIKLLVLPEIGGRLHGATDKTNGYNFFYWQPTIKPALIGMTGAWISGGVEWNFPTGHRPTGFSPVSYRLIENPDGSKTIWVGETEWIYRMRWLVGMTIYPGRSVIEAKVRLVNPTPLPHSFYMWATTAVSANENYQAIYPTRLMTGHGKFEYFGWPVNKGVDISWWKNSPNASSYFATEMGDFFGGYDHGKRAGTVLTGERHIVIGKKLWTWGTSPFGRMWEPILTEGQGPYFEPQAGAYSDNQPDFHWLQPGEVKSYSHFFFPVRDIGVFKQANVNGALNLEFSADSIKIGVYSTAILKRGTIRLQEGENKNFEETVTIDPSKPFIHQLPYKNASMKKDKFTLTLSDDNGKELITYTPAIPKEIEIPEPAKEFVAPERMTSNDQLYHAGEITYKFREPQRARPYFLEALKRDSLDTRANVMLAELDLKEAKFRSALQHLDRASLRDPDNGKIYYLQAVAQEALGAYDNAYDNYYRAVHFAAFLSQAYERISRLDLRDGEYAKAIDHILKAIETNSLNPQLWALKATSLRLSKKYGLAEEAARQAVEIDPLHPLGLNELMLSRKANGKPGETELGILTGVLRNDYQCYIELALQYINSGLLTDAGRILDLPEVHKIDNPMLVDYYQSFISDLSGASANAQQFATKAKQHSIDNIFPFRQESINILRNAIRIDKNDANAHYYLGLIYAGMADLDSATAHWQQAVQLDEKNARAWRCLGLSYLTDFGRQPDLKQARLCYQKASDLLPYDSRIMLEFDRVKEASGENWKQRLEFLKKNKAVVESRDDLLVRMLDLMVRNGEYQQALNYYQKHHFHNWEGQYSIHNAYMEACIGMAKAAKSPQQALAMYQKACEYPENLEIAPREPNLRGFLYYPMAMLYLKLGNANEAQRLLDITAGEQTHIPSLVNYYRGLALMANGQTDLSSRSLKELEDEGHKLVDGEPDSYVGMDGDLKLALGYFYLSKVSEVKGEKEKGLEYSIRAKELYPMIEREALIRAQITFAGAHQ